MRIYFIRAVLLISTSMLLLPAAYAEKLKPFILGNPVAGSMSQVVAKTKLSLKKNGFKLVGSYSPYTNAIVICATNNELIAAAGKAKNGGFGVAARVSVTKANGKIQVAYLNPRYIGTAYGLGKLSGVSAKLKAALGRRIKFGAKGVDVAKLAPGKYHYAMFMPYFKDISILNKFDDYKSAVATVERNLRAGKGGTKRVYRIDIPGKQISVFGVGINRGDGIDEGAKDTDKEVMDIIDFKKIKSTAYLPYELMVKGKQVIALRARFRIAVHFPDTKMAGKHGFTKIMSSPKGIKEALEAVSGYDKEKGFSRSDS